MRLGTARTRTMHIKLSKRVFNRMTTGEIEAIRRDHSNLRGLDEINVSLLDLERERVDKLRAALVRLKGSGTRMLAPLIADIDRWNDIMDGKGNAGDMRPSTLQQFADLLIQYLLTIPGQRVYMQEEGSNEWLPYYVNYVEHHREYRDRRRDFQPAYVEIHLMHWLLGNTYGQRVDLYNEDVNGYDVAAALAANGIFAETDDLRADYLKMKEEFDDIFDDVGRQYKTYRDRVSMMDEGAAAKVVIDVARDSSDETDSGYGARARTNFWNMKRPKAVSNKSTEHLSLNERRIVSDTLSEPPEIPLHPYIPVYHMGRHHRFRVNVKELEPYEYDKSLGEHLVLPAVTKDLIDVLVSQGRIAFTDIIQGKGAGACILLGGPPGTGKTLTAEVFAEATERPLLSVQAAQLGINPESIERQFRHILQLGSRWNAVVLLDEADVYIARRGADLQQNSIVASFLRMLEHHTATIFMTTNRAEDVDDAILSRCLARITYKVPDKYSQKRIWQVISGLNGIDLCDADIAEIVRRHGSLSGRDIKQVVKLASLWAARKGEQVTPETVDFVTEFLPTLSVSAEAGENHAA